ncbi:putative WRKY transcription factor 53, partial [Bienertia sinuspersici]
MENNESDSKKKGRLVNELVEGRDLTRKLQFVIANEPYSAANEAYGLMAKNILAKFDKALQTLQYDETNPSQLHQQQQAADSPNSCTGSQDSDGDFKDPVDRKDDSKKRRLSPCVTKRVQGCTSSGLEGPIEDGYNWRKYGQKDILGANFPRAYYRCTHRMFQGCLATKQVQRNDDDPSFFEVTYRGKHTCSQASSSSLPSNPTPKIQPVDTHNALPQQQPKNIIWDFKRDNLVEETKPKINHAKPSSFSYPSSSNLLVDTLQQNPTTMLDYNDSFPTNTSSYTYQSSPSLLTMSTIHPQGTNNSPNVTQPEVQFDFQ